MRQNQGDVLYAIVLDWPKDGKSVIKSLKKGNQLYSDTIGSVELLGNKGDLKFDTLEDGLHVALPKTQIGKHAFVLKISTKW